MKIPELVRRMLRQQLETHEHECEQHILRCREHLNKLERQLKDPTFHLSMGTSEPVRSMSGAYTSLYQAAGLREALLLLEPAPEEKKCTHAWHVHAGLERPSHCPNCREKGE